MWQKLPRVTGTTDITFRHDFVPDQTLITVAYDQRNLYIALDAHDRFAETIQANETRRDEHLWGAGDDVLEIFFDPDGTGDRLIQIAFNPIGTQWDYRKDDSEGTRRTGWNGSWNVATRINDNGWSAEVVFPFSDLPWDMPSPGDTLRANLARTSRNRRAHVYSSWSIITHAFHNSGQYGFWNFAAPDLDASPKDEIEINKEFVEVESQALKSLARRGSMEAAMVKSLAGETAQDATRLSDELLDQLSSKDDLDGLLQARLTGHSLKAMLKAASTELSLQGLAGPLDDPFGFQNGISESGGYWVLASGRGIYALARERGTVAGVWDRSIGSRIIAAAYDHYERETMNDKVFSDERFDQVENVERHPDGLTFVCRNPLLPGLTIRKEYRLKKEGQILSKQIHVSQSARKKTLLGVSTDTVFDPVFRASSRYNRVSCRPDRREGRTSGRALTPAK